MRAGNLEVVYRTTADLVPYARNARTHSEEQVAQLVESIKRFGWTNPITIDAAGGIIAGHGRVLAAQRMGMAEVPCITLSHLTDAEKRAYVIADNQHALNAGWDAALLRTELMDLQSLVADGTLAGLSMDAIGFNAVDLDAAIHALDEDDLPGSQASLLALINVTIAEPKTVVHRGDVWLIGNHVLVVCSVVEDWPTWKPHLVGAKALFCPYPGPMILASDRARATGRRAQSLVNDAVHEPHCSLSRLWSMPLYAAGGIYAVSK